MAEELNYLSLFLPTVKIEQPQDNTQIATRQYIDKQKAPTICKAIPVITQDRTTPKTEGEKYMTEKAKKQVELKEKQQKEAEQKVKALEGVNNLLDFTSPAKHYEQYTGKDLNGTTEFVFDVLADPTTYATFGGLPLIKKLGRKHLSELTEKSSKQMLEHAFDNLNSKTPYASHLINSSGEVLFSQEKGKPATIYFTPEDLLNHGNTRLLRTLNDAEYREALQRVFPNQYKELLNGQIQELNKAKINFKIPPKNKGSIMETLRHTHTIGNYTASASELAAIIKRKYPDLSVDDVLRNIGLSEEQLRRFNSDVPEILISDDAIKALNNQTKLNQEQLRKLFFHEGTHATGAIVPNGDNFITSYNSQFPVKVQDWVTNKTYYSNPDEVRARAMSIRRLHQATGDSYENILNNWNKGIYRPDPNIDDLINIYDKTSLLEYLNNFLEKGGVVNKIF